jgi:hypothetical protein
VSTVICEKAGGRRPKEAAELLFQEISENEMDIKKDWQDVTWEK